jgi:hypothetical protein
MPVHEFDFDDSNNPRKMTDQRFDPRNRTEGVERRPNSTVLPVAHEAKPRDDILFERQNVNISEEIHEILPQGYRTMDRGIKNYFSGIQVPTKDSVRLMGVRISGGDKPYLVWAQDLRRGRVQLPVMAIRREGDEHNPMKFNPAHLHYMSKRFLDPDGTRVALAYRPVPALISYTLSAWAEHKRDLEYIFYQIRARFNPIASFMVEDEHIRGEVIMKYEGMTVAVDDEVPADQRQNKRYDYSITMEGWLPLPEKVVPTVLGRVTSFREHSSKIPKGDVLDVIHGKDVLNVAQLR